MVNGIFLEGKDLMKIPSKRRNPALADNDDFTLILYNLNYGSSYATQVNENVIENVIEISEEK